MTVFGVRGVLLAASCLAFSIPPAAGLAPDRRIGEYTRTVWEATDGLPMNTVHSLLQTRDGYVWLATEEGVVRFDGVRFEVFNPSTTPALPGKDTKSLFEARDGSLWIGMTGGAARFSEGRLTRRGGIGGPHAHRGHDRSRHKGDRERCLAEGMDDYVSKPIDPGVLFGVIERILAARLSPSPR